MHWLREDFPKSIQSWPPCRVGRLRWQMRGRVNQRSSWNLPRVIFGKRYTAQSANNPSWFRRMIIINAFQAKVFFAPRIKDHNATFLQTSADDSRQVGRCAVKKCRIIPHPWLQSLRLSHRVDKVCLRCDRSNQKIVIPFNSVRPTFVAVKAISFQVTIVKNNLKRGCKVGDTNSCRFL